ncbi:hypothetical protein JCM8547_000675 [Rhodosporidiobolus lusitaniae]
MSDSELDYDDPRFLEQLTASAPPPADLSYAERRKRKLLRSEDKQRNAPKSSKQHEELVREEGLNTNLIAQARLDEQREGAQENKALKMMKMMGFTPGEALGRKRDEAEEASSSSPPTRTGGGGLGFAKASFAPAASTSTASPPASSTASDKPRTEPIKFEMRTGRTGLGVPLPRKPVVLPRSLLPLDSSTTPLPDLSSYLSHLKSTLDSKRAFGLLRNARRTCEDLDRRNGVEENVMWRDPEEEQREREREGRKRLWDKVDEEVDSEDERKGEETERRREKRRKEKEDRGEGLGYETGVSGTVVETEEEREEDREGGEKSAEEEEKEWFDMDVQTRLGLTLTYLRQTYHYCLWCGAMYDSSEDMEENCPGTEEEDH